MIKVEVKKHKKGFALYLDGDFLGVSSSETSINRVRELIATTLSEQYDEGYTDGHFQGYDDGHSDAEFERYHD